MELLQELFVTVIVALLFSFLIAKLVSLGGAGDADSNQNSQLLKSQNTDQENTNETIMEDLSYRERLEVKGFESEKKVEFVQDVSRKVDQLCGESKPVNVDEVIETECSELPQDSIQEGPKEENNLAKENSEIEPIRTGQCYAQSQNDAAGEESEDIRVDCKSNKEKDEERKEKKIEIIESDDDDDDDWEGIERSELEKEFAKAAKFLESDDKEKEEGLQMELYALHKVATEGPCHEQPPMALKLAARAKWNAWQRLGNMNPEVAMEQYIALVSDKVPGWMEDTSTGNGKPGSAEEVNPGGLASDLTTKNIAEERNPEATTDTEKNDLTGVSNMESRAKE
ncbi:acyl-CoA-binding domain-containing protein 3 [Ricinus communis]|uniref:acyl-CoA-binding domain-containing protein 3 n=1 Tax=Ricinus communis TaxID=3988 RepID=UPI00077257EB|nr:acyl-CoA-binding domain-containing protein 3 [Ricinus communis]|eukprot:XP_015575893.1 acyl-CoA-binding domain-containing protein 3 [Ricinus communis]